MTTDLAAGEPVTAPDALGLGVGAGYMGQALLQHRGPLVLCAGRQRVAVPGRH
jgi:hypothetical protein